MEDKLIDLYEILYLFKKKLWVLILVTGIVTALGFYKASLMEVTYQASAKIFVGKGENLLDYYSQSEIQYYTEFMNTFSEIIKVDDFLDTTLKKYNINKSSSEVKNSLSFFASENTPIFTVNYYTWKQEGAVETLTAICEEFNEQAKTILPDTKPRIIDSAKVYPIIPNKQKVMVMHFGIGLILSIALILIWDYLDDTIKTKDRLEKVLPIPVLGEIPKHERGFKEDRG
ncbi:MAG: Wzz/FepE/Etk N-terminal domain-containing protein [Peptostreptococcaceae bacterium]